MLSQTIVKELERLESGNYYVKIGDSEAGNWNAWVWDKMASSRLDPPPPDSLEIPSDPPQHTRLLHLFETNTLMYHIVLRTQNRAGLLIPNSEQLQHKVGPSFGNHAWEAGDEEVGHRCSLKRS